MSKETALSSLKQAFDEGFKAFQCIVANESGYCNNPPNPYRERTLVHKEFERGFNTAYLEQQKVNKEVGV